MHGNQFERRIKAGVARSTRSFNPCVHLRFPYRSRGQNYPLKAWLKEARLLFPSSLRVTPCPPWLKNLRVFLKIDFRDDECGRIDENKTLRIIVGMWVETLRYVPILEFPILIVMVLIRAAMLRRHGIKALVFGATDKKDFFILPVILPLFYALTASVIDLPFPGVLISPLFKTPVLYALATIICTISLVWFGVTLKTFGKSFRVGIDEKTKEKLIRLSSCDMRCQLFISYGGRGRDAGIQQPVEQ